MKCRQCSAEIPETSSFCNRCGAAQADDRPARLGARAAASAAPAEETRWTGRYSLRAAVHLWLLSGAWIAAVLLLYLRFVEARTRASDGVALGAGFLPAAWVLGQVLMRKLSLRYRLTNYRLFTERGLFSRQHDELELIRVDDISVRQNLLERLFAVGTVSVLSSDASNPDLEIQGIERPLELKELIRAQVQERRARTTFLETL